MNNNCDFSLNAINNSNKILLLGGTGHLGSTLTHILVEDLKIDPKNIRIFYLPGTSTLGISDIKGLDLFPGNILDVSDLEKAFEDMDYVFHMIGNTTFDPRLKRTQWLVNVEGTRNVLETMRCQNHIKRMIYTSTVNTLGIPDPFGSIGKISNSNPYKNSPRMHSFTNSDEILKFSDNVKNNSETNWEKKIGICYFDSKLAAQEMINRYVSIHDMDIVSILPGTMFGPYDSLIGSGMYLLSIYHNMMPGVLNGGFPLTHVKDVAEGHILALDKGKKGKRYIMTGFDDDNRYLIDMVKIIGEIIKERYPNKRIKIPKLVIPKYLAISGAFFSEIFTKFTKKSNPLSRDSVKVLVKLLQRCLNITKKMDF